MIQRAQRRSTGAAELSATAHEKATELLRADALEHELTHTAWAGETHLTDEMKEIDSLVEKIIA